MRRLLIVEDSPEDRELLEKLAKGMTGVEVITVTSGDEALDVIGRVTVSCVVVDYVLDGEDGLEVSRAILDASPRVPVVLLTGQGNEILEAEAVRLGVTRYLPKHGLNQTLFQTAIRTLIHRAEWVSPPVD